MIINNQDAINTFFEARELINLPKTFLIVGDYGCGKKLLIDKLAKKYNAELKNIDDPINKDLVYELEDINTLTFISIDGDNLSQLEQNKVLKFIEDNNSSCYIFIVCTNLNNILETIKNRCQIILFEKYSKDYLKLIFYENDNNLQDINYSDYLYICNTPGKIKKYNYNYFSILLDYAKKLIDNFDKISISNLLFLSDKLNFKKDKELLKLFVSILEKECLNRILSNSNNNICKIILNSLIELKNSYYIINSDLSIYFDYFIIKTRVSI